MCMCYHHLSICSYCALPAIEARALNHLDHPTTTETPTQSLLRKYIGEYVACTTCKSPNTTLSRDSVSRLYFVHCQSCGSSRSVAPIRTGFHAQTRADRRALRK